VFTYATPHFRSGDTVTVRYGGGGGGSEALSNSGSMGPFTDHACSNPLPASGTIHTISNSAGQALVTTTASHGLGASTSKIWVKGTGTAGYDRAYLPIGSVNSLTTFHPGIAYLAPDSYWGTWEVIFASRDIATIVDDGGGNPLMTTNGTLTVVGGEMVVVEGTSDAFYNHVWGPISAPNSPSTVVLATPGGGPVPSATGGAFRVLDGNDVSGIAVDGLGTVTVTTYADHGITLPAWVEIRTGTYAALWQAADANTPGARKFALPTAGDLGAAGRTTWRFPGGNVASCSLYPVDPENSHLLITTVEPHGLTAGFNSIRLAGTAGGVYDNSFAVDETPDSFSIVSYGGYSVDSSGGTWDLPPL
jgi:hypothetical protein